MSSKRKVSQEDGESSDGESSSYAPSAIDVSFDFVPPTEIDFMALKRLVQQLYYTHSPELDIGALADWIIKIGSAPDAAVGTVVKVEDDADADPFAFASAIPLRPSEPAAKVLYDYYEKVLGGASSSKAAQSIWKAIRDDNTNVVQVFHERMVNMPPQIMPPLYRMLFEEVNNKEKDISHYVFFSRVFSTEAFSDEDEDDAQDTARSGAGASRAKRTKKAAIKNRAITTATADDLGGDTPDVGLFHPEDALIAKYAEATYTFRFPGVKDSDESFNAPVYGRLVLVNNDKKKIQALLSDMDTALAVPVAA